MPMRDTARLVDAGQRSPVDNAVWRAGQWTSTFQSQTGSVFAVGYWSAIFVRESDAWKIRVWTINQTPPPTPRAETK